MRLYAGIGSRETPQSIINEMYRISRKLAMLGYTLRSGRAKGADTAFEYGARSVNGKLDLFVASDAMTHNEWFYHAAQFHPAWSRLDNRAKALHARNSPIVLGERLDTPVDFVVCWTKDGLVSGGTGQALRIANHLRIEVFNLYNPKRLIDLQVRAGFVL